MNVLKEQLEQIINSPVIDEDLFWINMQEYETMFPMDFDILTIKTSFFIQTGKYMEAEKYGLEAVIRNFNSIEAHYNLACLYELMGRYCDCFEYYTKTYVLQQLKKYEIIADKELKNYINNVIIPLFEAELLQQSQEVREKYIYYRKSFFELGKDAFKELSYDVTGTMFTSCEGKKYYAGWCDDWLHSVYKEGVERNVYASKCELFEIVRQDTGIKIVSDDNLEYILPIVAQPKFDEKDRVTLAVNYEGKNAIFVESACEKFDFLRIKGDCEIYSNENFLISNPLNLVRFPQNKNLVLNIFVDSLSYEIIKSEVDALKYIPNIYRFFKKGCICTNAYVGAEFTFPSIASYSTGLYTNHHMMADSRIYNKLPMNTPILSELFKKVGYVTAKIGGNDSVTPQLGYIRGIDRFLYQYTSQGYNVHQVVNDVIEHMEAFQECNQYIWMDLADLHDVAGGFQRSISVQSKIKPEYRQADNENRGNTVKQTYSPNRTHIYMEELKRVDRCLQVLFQYIEEHYSDDHIVVSFFSDHGTAFMVEDEKPFLDEYRTHVPMMFRGGNVKGICDEYIESVDYGSIMCRLAGINRDDNGLDGKLPKWFGGAGEKEYVFSQSIFPGDPYRAAVFNKEHSYYLDTTVPVSPECFIDVSQIQTLLLSKDRQPIQDEALVRKYRDIILEKVADIIKY